MWCTWITGCQLGLKGHARLGAYDQALPNDGGLRMVDDGRNGHRSARVDISGDSVKARERPSAHSRRKDIHGAAAGQCWRVQVAAGNSVPYECRPTGCSGFPAELVHRRLDTSTGYRADGFPIGPDDH